MPRAVLRTGLLGACQRHDWAGLGNAAVPERRDGTGTGTRPGSGSGSGGSQGSGSWVAVCTAERTGHGGRRTRLEGVGQGVRRGEGHSGPAREGEPGAGTGMGGGKRGGRNQPGGGEEGSGAWRDCPEAGAVRGVSAALSSAVPDGDGRREGRLGAPAVLPVQDRGAAGEYSCGGHCGRVTVLPAGMVCLCPRAVGGQDPLWGHNLGLCFELRAAPVQVLVTAAREQGWMGSWE